MSMRSVIILSGNIFFFLFNPALKASESNKSDLIELIDRALVFLNESNELNKTTGPKQVSDILDNGIDFVKNSLLLGAITNYHDMKKTKGYTGDLIKRLRIGSLYKKSKKSWQAESSDLNKVFYTIPKQSQLLKNTNKKIKSVIESAHLSMASRAGNCEEQANLLAYYLWKKFPDFIDRIEIVSGVNFDHTFCIINRSQNSLLEDPSSWGEDAWIADPWLNSYYQAKNYLKNIEKDLKQAIEDASHMEKEFNHKWAVMTNGKSIEDKEAFLLRASVDISPNEDEFPTELDESIQILDFPAGVFYDLKDFAEAKKIHSGRFKESLARIRKSECSLANKSDMVFSLKDQYEEAVTSFESEVMLLAGKVCDEDQEYVKNILKDTLNKMFFSKKKREQLKGRERLYNVIHDQDFMDKVLSELEENIRKHLLKNTVDRKSDLRSFKTFRIKRAIEKLMTKFSKKIHYSEN